MHWDLVIIIGGLVFVFLGFLGMHLYDRWQIKKAIKKAFDEYW